MTLFAYDSAGSQETVAIDMDRNDEIDYAGSDRISRTTTGIATNNGIAVQRTISRVWTTEGVDANEIVAISDSAPDGTASWQISYGLTNATTVSVDRFHARRTVTTVAADGTRNVAMSENGLMRTNIFYAADDSVVSTTKHEYDLLNRQTRVIDGRGIVTATAYNNAGQVVAVTNACGTTNQQTTTYQHDSMGRQIAVTTPDNTVKYTAYLLTGEVSTNWGSQTYPVAYTFDYAGRKKTMTTWTNFTSNAGAAVTTWNYDPTNGLLVSKIYPNPATGGSGGEGPTYTYTPGGSLSTRTWARGIVTTYSHDNAGQQTAVHYSDGTPAVTNTFDRRGRRIATSSSADSIAYGFNDVGQVISETHSDGALDGVILTNVYDTVQRRLSVAAVKAGKSLSTSFFGYDQASRIGVVSNASGFSVVYSYMPGVNMVTGIVFSADGVAKMNTVKTYDDLYRLTLIQSATATGVVNSFTYQYNAANQRSQTVMSDGTYWNYIYDYLGQVSNAVRRWASDNTVVFGQDYQYLFDDIGNRVNVSRNAVESEYSVNLLNQYTSRTVPASVQINGAAAEAAYVTVNNVAAARRGEFFSREFTVTNTFSAVWSPVEVVAVLKNAGSNGADIVSSQSGHAFVAQTPEAFAHDQDGNLTQDGRWEYSWDGENRLTAVETRTNVTGMTRTRCEFTYDAQSRRIAKTSLSGWTGTSYSTTNTSLFVYDGWLLLSELQVSGLNLQVLTNSYTWGLDLSGSLQGAGGIGGVLFSQLSNPATSNATTVFYTYDGNGNVADLVDANGTLAAHYEYSPFGETLVATGPLAAANRIRFSTKYWDHETGLGYWGYRYYNPETGRWISRDPVSMFNGSHVYDCAHNNLIEKYDFLGMWSTDIHEKATSDWATETKFALDAAKKIGKKDEAVDYPPTMPIPVPLIGDQSFHFNIPIGGEDSRLKHASDDFKAAKKVCDWSEDNDDYEEAVRLLGRALHARQDWYAHGDYSGSSWHNINGPLVEGWKKYEEPTPKSYPDTWYLDAADSPDGRVVGEDVKKDNRAKFVVGYKRFTDTRETTKIYLKAFRSHVMFKSKKCGECKKFFLGKELVYKESL